MAWITGGGSGIGRATALLMAREGAKVAVADLDGAQAEETAALVRAAGGTAIALAQDVTDEDGWDVALATIVQAFGRLDVLVNNAGVGLTMPVTETTLKGWRRVMAVNTDAVFLGTRTAMRAMRETGGGSIVNISSIYGIVVAANVGAYAASKGAVRLFTKVAAVEAAQAGWNIRVNSVHPAFIDTPMVRRHTDLSADPEQSRQKVAQAHPMGRLGRPEEIAEGILYLASDASSFMTGSELVIDGGYTAV